MVVGGHVVAVEVRREECALATKPAEGTRRWVLSGPLPHRYSALQAALEWYLAYLVY